MKTKRKPYTVTQLASAVFMILALLWLTVSTPFVFAGQQELAKQNKTINTGTPIDINDEENANPFGNTTEEKAPKGGPSFSEEYIHDNNIENHFISSALQFHKGENADTYIAYHGELHVPPPNAA